MAEYFSIEGLSGLNDKLVKLGVKTGAKVLRKAGRESMKPVENSMQAGANEDTGQLKLSIGMRARLGSRSDKNRAATISVGPIRKTVKGEKLVDINQKAVAQEFGNARQSADPFIRPALDNNKERVLRNIKRELKAGIDGVAK